MSKFIRINYELIPIDNIAQIVWEKISGSQIGYLTVHFKVITARGDGWTQAKITEQEMENYYQKWVDIKD